ncbi:uncharacterized protein LOC114975560 [Acropora millepora]|uniref:uncharacterized protein LOC114975560 n=1 Tax=Acropora millepora TaxID=45264 RepID=UPI001CF0FB06|nr:uncharacterized protein LOC114975560 [Acropora millepora]
MEAPPDGLLKKCDSDLDCFYYDNAFRQREPREVLHVCCARILIYDVIFKNLIRPNTSFCFEEMVASWVVVLWHKIVLSRPVWFLFEVFAKKPWKWSLFGSLSLTSFIPLSVLIVFPLMSTVFTLISLVILQCGLLTVAIASLVSSGIMITPLAILSTFFIYSGYKFSLLAAHVVIWFLNAITRLSTRIRHNVKGVVFPVFRCLCSWRHFKKKHRKAVALETRLRAEQRIKQRNTRHFPDDAVECPITDLEENQKQQRGVMACLEILKQSFREESLSEDCPDQEDDRQSVFYISGIKSTGWLDWLRKSESSISAVSENSVGTYRHSQENSGSSSGSGSSSYATASEWLAEDCIGNIIPDYRDTDSKMYDALLKRDFCRGEIKT